MGNFRKILAANIVAAEVRPAYAIYPEIKKRTVWERLVRPYNEFDFLLRPPYLKLMFIGGEQVIEMDEAVDLEHILVGEAHPDIMKAIADFKNEIMSFNKGKEKLDESYDYYMSNYFLGN